MKTILVISRDGENPDDIAAKYSEEYKIEPKYVRLTKNESYKYRLESLKELLFCMANKDIKDILSDSQMEYIEEKYLEYKRMSNEEYFNKETSDCEVDENGNAWSDKNTNAHYRYPKCYQDTLERTGEEAPFSNPFKLKDGGIAYRAHFNDIDWELMHDYNREVYESAWELCVENREPKNRQEHMIKEQMKNRSEYFLNFSSKEDYVDYSCKFFTFGIATKDKFIQRDRFSETEMEYIRSYFDKYIKTIEGNPTLSIYEVRSL